MSVICSTRPPAHLMLSIVTLWPALGPGSFSMACMVIMGGVWMHCTFHWLLWSPCISGELWWWWPNAGSQAMQWPVRTHCHCPTHQQLWPVVCQPQLSASCLSCLQGAAGSIAPISVSVDEMLSLAASIQLKLHCCYIYTSISRMQTIWKEPVVVKVWEWHVRLSPNWANNQSGFHIFARVKLGKGLDWKLGSMCTIQYIWQAGTRFRPSQWL